MTAVGAIAGAIVAATAGIGWLHNRDHSYRRVTRLQLALLIGREGSRIGGSARLHETNAAAEFRDWCHTTARRLVLGQPDDVEYHLPSIDECYNVISEWNTQREPWVGPIPLWHLRSRRSNAFIVVDPTTTWPTSAPDIECLP